MLKITGVSKRFGGLHALNEVSLNVEKGKIFSLIGPNGAGKTTLFNLITGSLPADSGKIEFMEKDITGLKPHIICRKGIARTYQQKNLFPNLTVYDNIASGMLKEARGIKDIKERVYQILAFLGLVEKADLLSPG